MSPDSIYDVSMSASSTWNKYAYVANNPLNRVDADGRMMTVWFLLPWDLVGGGGYVEHVTVHWTPPAEDTGPIDGDVPEPWSWPYGPPDYTETDLLVDEDVDGSGISDVGVDLPDDVDSNTQPVEDGTECGTWKRGAWVRVPCEELSALLTTQRCCRCYWHWLGYVSIGGEWYRKPSVVPPDFPGTNPTEGLAIFDTRVGGDPKAPNRCMCAPPGSDKACPWNPQ
jgi:hypothetical protein